MKKLFTILIFLVSSQIYSQDLFEVFNFPKVIINKKYIAFTIGYSTMKNGIQSEIKYNTPNTDNPTFLTIISDNNGGKMTVTNKHITEDIIINFKAIYKDNSNGKIVYHFATTDSRCDINFYIESESNDVIILSFNQDDKNSISYIYTLAKLY